MGDDMTTETTLQDFVNARGLRMSARPVDRNPHQAGGWEADHWRCTIRGRHHTLNVYFSKGVGHNGKEPDIFEVLDCLASDAAGIENARSFEEWCGEYGYDPDSRAAEKTYRVCEKQAERLKAFLGEGDYRKLLFETERE